MTTDPETGSTVPPATPAPNRQNRRKQQSKPPKSQPPRLTPEQELHRLRGMVFTQAHQSLEIIKAISEETSTMHPARQEISEALRLLRSAYTEAGLDFLRPVVAQLKRLEEQPLKLVEPAADTAQHENSASLAG